ncbi:MAG: TonB-dependent receptor [Thermonemataceae bacterium]|nr:TonB-dependent receptor [Thermonemataceae bacterium]
MHTKYYFFLSILLLSLKSYGQDTLSPATHEIEVEDLLKSKAQNDEFEDVSIITTSRTSEQKSSKAPGTVYVVTAEQIQKRGYTSLAELLQDVPNVKIDNLSDPRWNNNVIIRGVTGSNANANDKFILLIDGVRANSPTNDIIPVIENYPIHFAKQVEIVFGPASALYGADAFAGVINIITKSADDLKRNEASAMLGAYNYYLGNIALGRKVNDKLSYTLAAQYMYDQQPQMSKFYPEEYKTMESNLASGTFNTIFGPIKADVNPVYSQTPLSAYAIHANVRYGDFSFSFFKNKSVNPSTFALNPDNGVYNAGSFFGHSVTMGNITYNKTLGKLQLNSFLVGSWYNLDPESTFRNVYTNLQPAYLFSKGEMLKAEQIAAYKLNERINFTAGATFEYFFSNPRGHDLQYPIYNRTQRPIILGSNLPNNPLGIEADIPELYYTNLGGFAQAEFGFAEKLFLTLGGRFDNSSRYGSTLNPRFGLVFEANKSLIFKLLSGRAYLAPSPLASFDQFGTFFSTDNGTTYQSFFFRLPSPNLKPQTIQTFEFSGTYSEKKFRATLNAFYSISEGLFDYGADATNGNLYNGTYKGWPVAFIEVAINRGRQNSFGGSLQLEYRSNFGKNNKLNSYISASYVGGSVEISDNNATQKVELPAVAPLILKAGIDLDLGKFSISPRVIYVNEQHSYAPSQENKDKRQRLGGYALLNLQANYKLSNYFTLFLQGRNMLDQRYYGVNLGASPEATLGGGAAQAEISKGAPQNPIRIMGGFNIKF